MLVSPIDADENSTRNPNEGGSTEPMGVTREKTPETEKRDVVKRLESGGRILSLIKKAETKRVAKRKIITFLKKKGVSESKIIEAYSHYYKEEGLYEITFNQRPLGFSVIMDTRGKNAIVSSVQDETNEKLGMKVASRIYEINGKRVDDLKHKEILKLMAQQATPFYVVFKESKKKSSKFQKKQAKIAEGLTFKDEEELKDEGDEEESDSDTVSSYDSDDDEAHVYNHYARKKESAASKKKKKKKQDAALFKPHELDQWDQDRLADEQAAMLKQLSRLMMGAVAASDQAQGDAPVSMNEIDGMSHKRKKTLKTLLDVTGSTAEDDSTQEKAKHEIKKSMSLRKFSVTDLQATEEEEYDPEIFKYLSELVGDPQQQQQQQIPPLTPSTSKIMKDLFFDANDMEEMELNLPDFGSGGHANGSSGGMHGNLGNASYGSPVHSAQYSESQASELSAMVAEESKDDEEDVIESMEQGTTLLKYGKYGKPKYKSFNLTPDHKYLVWFSPKKSSDETRIKIKEIRKIAIGSESKVVEKTKQKDLHETSFTIYYGKTTNDKEWKSLTVTAKNEKEAFVWAQGLKILSDAAKKGRHLRSLSTAQIPANLPDNENESGSPPPKHGGHHQKQESVILSIDKLQNQSVLNLFSKSSSATTTSLLKQHAKHKQQLQKCVDFVMTKANYRAIANAGQFEKVKLKLEDLDNRLRDVKQQLTTNDDLEQSVLSQVKADLFACAADLDALKQKLTAIVRRPQKL
eukprot:CAMPEP_0197024632 /NCGR_PEP_ID=MMETSP1384-20130603/5142_1 /TAXON_ID=29189 /ORGANISM="Ammonia sp." /LENGTH=746 /DNA_ID=CAMNT_0042453047 /DNA_START=51 /DNA_END=2291 /DNA_ORIENTATION=-